MNGTRERHRCTPAIIGPRNPILVAFAPPLLFKSMERRSTTRWLDKRKFLFHQTIPGTGTLAPRRPFRRWSLRLASIGPRIYFPNYQTVSHLEFPCSLIYVRASGPFRYSNLFRYSNYHEVDGFVDFQLLSVIFMGI